MTEINTNFDNKIELPPPYTGSVKKKTSEKILHNITLFFSIALHPLLMPFYAVLTLYAYTNFFLIYTALWQILFVVLLFSCIIPAVFILILKLFGFIENLSLQNQKDRMLPYAITCFANICMTYYFSQQGFPIWFTALLSAGVFVIILGASINPFWKISAHMLGIGGLIGSIMAICFLVNHRNPFLLLMTLFILAGCLGVSRLYLKRHTPLQVYIGFVVGLVVSFAAIWAITTFTIFNLLK